MHWRRLGLDGLLLGGGCCDSRDAVVLDDLAARPEGEGVPVGQVILAFSDPYLCNHCKKVDRV